MAGFFTARFNRQRGVVQRPATPARQTPGFVDHVMPPAAPIAPQKFQLYQGSVPQGMPMQLTDADRRNIARSQEIYRPSEAVLAAMFADQPRSQAVRGSGVAPGTYEGLSIAPGDYGNGGLAIEEQGQAAPVAPVSALNGWSMTAADRAIPMVYTVDEYLRKLSPGGRAFTALAFLGAAEDFANRSPSSIPVGESFQLASNVMDMLAISGNAFLLALQSKALPLKVSDYAVRVRRVQGIVDQWLRVFASDMKYQAFLTAQQYQDLNRRFSVLDALFGNIPKSGTAAQKGAIEQYIDYALQAGTQFVDAAGKAIAGAAEKLKWPLIGAGVGLLGLGLLAGAALFFMKR